jgi:hypothetical protein
MSANSSGESLVLSPALLSIRKYTLEKNLMSGMNVEKPSLILPILFVTRKFITLSAFSVQ